MNRPDGLRVARLGPNAWSLEPADLPAGLIDRARALMSLATYLGDARDPVVGSRSVVVMGADPSHHLARFGSTVQAPLSSSVEPTKHVIPVAYDGPDLEAVAEATGLSVEAVIERHAGVVYTAVLCGFLPGFMYLAETSPDVQMPRKSAPRAKVTPRSVGIAGPYTGIYPSACPGGWNLLGDALTGDLFDPLRARPLLVNLLDRVKFVRTDRAAASVCEPRGYAQDEEPTAELAHVTITRLSGLASLVDRGRSSHRRFGVPLGGPLDRESYEELATTCALDTCLELMAGAVELTVTRGSTWLASNGEPARRLSQGESLRFEAGSSLTRLIALGGEPRVARVLGSRSSLVGFAWAGRLGRPLLKGDTLSIEPAEEMPTTAARAIDAGQSEVVLGFEPLFTAAGRLDGVRLEIGAASSRVGTRLHGNTGTCVDPTVLSTGESHPMVPGAIQETPDGTLIVLGPDSATLGGYPIVGVLTEQARSALARQRPGRAVRLRLI